MKKINSGALYVLRRACAVISPILASKVHHRLRMGYWANLKTPKMYSEKLIWIQYNVYAGNPLISRCADKLKVRGYVEEIGCSELLNPLIAVYGSPEEIDWDQLPDRFALKLNTGCGYNIICNDKESLDQAGAVRKFKKWMKCRYYLKLGEMQYKGIEPKILVEKNLCDEKGGLPTDYKFFCFHGVAKYVAIVVGRDSVEGTRYHAFDRHWQRYDFYKNPATKVEDSIPKPEGIEAAFDYADRLAQEFPFVRVDLYIIEGQVVFSELTFSPSGSVERRLTEEGDRTYRDLMRLELLI